MRTSREADGYRFRDFEAFTKRYDAWFEKHRAAFLSELRAVRYALPEGSGLGLEVGVGTGRFAAPLGVQIGLDPAVGCLQMAKERGIHVVAGVGEELPFRAGAFDILFMIVAFCFLKEPDRALEEARRVLKPGGLIIVGIIDRESPLGRLYELKKAEGAPFYRDAVFYTPEEVRAMLEAHGFKDVRFIQTLFGPLERIEDVQEAMEGYGKGSFVVIRAERP